jgi:hypothetical protein
MVSGLLEKKRDAIPLHLKHWFHSYIIISGLLNDAVSNSGYIASNQRMINNELEGVWKEEDVA